VAEGLVELDFVIFQFVNHSGLCFFFCSQCQKLVSDLNLDISCETARSFPGTAGRK
jgi:hypothetical protein